MPAIVSQMKHLGKYGTGGLGALSIEGLFYIIIKKEIDLFFHKNMKIILDEAEYKAIAGITAQEELLLKSELELKEKFIQEMKDRVEYNSGYPGGSLTSGDVKDALDRLEEDLGRLRKRFKR